MRGDAGAEVAPSGPQDPPATVEAMPSGSQVLAGGPEATVPPTATADPTTVIPSNTPSVVGVGARQVPSCRQLQRNRRLFLGDLSGLASSQKQRRLPSLRCCPALIRLSRKPRRQSCGSGRHSTPSTSALATGAPNWRSALRRRPANLPQSGPSLSGSARTSRRTSERCLTESRRWPGRRKGWSRSRNTWTKGRRSSRHSIKS
jgi:hypothetical protein